MNDLIIDKKRKAAEIKNISKPIQQKFTKNSIKWLSNNQKNNLDIVERDMSIIVTFVDGTERNYGYVEISEIFNSSIELRNDTNLNCCFIELTQIHEQSLYLESQYAFFTSEKLRVIDTSFKSLNLKGAILLYKSIEFIRTKFEMNYLSFLGTQFLSNELTFSEVTFECKGVNFRDSVMNGKKIRFNKSHFECKEINFDGANYESATLYFIGVYLDNATLSFSHAYINRLLFFDMLFPCYINLKVNKCNEIAFCDSNIEKNVDIITSSSNRMISLCLYNTNIIGNINIDWNKSNVKSLIENSIDSFMFEIFPNIEVQKFEFISQQFLQLKENYNRNGQYNNEDESLYYYKKNLRLSKKYCEDVVKKKKIRFCFIKVYRNMRSTIEAIIFEKVGGYGTKPKNIFRSMMFVWVSFAFLYAFIPNGIKHNFVYDDYIPTWLGKLSTGFYFSVITFVTVGYGDVAPVRGLTTILAMIEGFLGVFLMSYFSGSFVRKLLR